MLPHTHYSINLPENDVRLPENDVKETFVIFYNDSSRVRTCAGIPNGFQVHLLNHSDMLPIKCIYNKHLYFLVNKYN